MTEHVPAAAAPAWPVDAEACPVCGLPLPAAVCRWCGTDLRDGVGARLMELHAQAERALAERRDLLTQLRAHAGRHRVAPPGSTDRIPRQRSSYPSAPVRPPGPSEPATVPHSPAATAVSAAASHGLDAVRAAAGWVRPALTPARLFGMLAAGLVVGAMLGFLVSPADRAGNLRYPGAVTLSVLGVLVTAAARWSALRRRSADQRTGTDGVVVAVLVIGDVWLIRDGGLLGADHASLLGFLAASVTATASALLCFGLLGRLPAALAAGALLAPLSPVLAACWVATGPGTTAAARPAVLATGLLGGALLTTVRGLDGLTPVQLTVHRIEAAVALIAATAVVAVTSVTSLTPHAAGAPRSARTGLSPALTVVFALALLVAVLLQSLPDRGTGLRRPWQLAAAALLPLVSGLATQVVVQLAVGMLGRFTGHDAAPGWWPFPLGAAATAFVLGRWADGHDPFQFLPAATMDSALPSESQAHRRRVASVGGISADLAATPLVALAVEQLAAVAEMAVPPWRHGTGLVAPGGGPLPLLLTAATLLATTWLHRGPSRVGAVIPTVLAGTALVAAPVAPGTPLWAGLPLLAVLCAGSLRLASLREPRGLAVGRRPARAVAVAAGVVALVAAQAVPTFAAAVSLACAATLLIARRHAADRWAPRLLALAISCVVIGAGAVAALLPEPPAGRAFVVALLTAATAAVTATAVPLSSRARGVLLEAAVGVDLTRAVRSLGRIGTADCTAVVVTSGITALVGLLPALGSHPSPAAAAVVTGLLLVAAVIGRALPSVGSGFGPRVLSAAVPPLAAGTAALVAVIPAQAAQAWAPSVLPAQTVVVLSASVVVAALAGASGVSGRLSPGDSRRVAGEIGLVIAAVGSVAVALLTTGPVTWWGVAVVFGVALGGAALPHHRRKLAWPSAGVLVAAGWVSLVASGQWSPDGFAVVAAGAVAVLAVAVAPAGGRRRSRLQVAAVALAVVPGVVASSGTLAWRPATWLACSALALGVAMLPANARPAVTATTTATEPVVAAELGGPSGRSLLLATSAAGATAGTAHAVGEVARRLLSSEPSVLSPTAVEAWSLPAAALVLACVIVRRSSLHLPPRRVSTLGVPILGLAVGPTALAAALEASADQGFAPPGAGLRAAALMAACACAAVWLLGRPGAARNAGVARRALGVAVLAAALGAGVRGPVDAWTVPLGVMLLVAQDRLGARVDGRQWWPLTSGLVVLLGPGLWLVIAEDGNGARPVVVVALGTAVSLVGLFRRRVPLVVGGLVTVAATAVRVGGPSLLVAAARLPRWSDVALVAAVVLVLAAVRGRRGDGSDDGDDAREAARG